MINARVILNIGSANNRYPKVLVREGVAEIRELIADADSLAGVTLGAGDVIVEPLAANFTLTYNTLHAKHPSGSYFVLAPMESTPDIWRFVWGGRADAEVPRYNSTYGTTEDTVFVSSNYHAITLVDLGVDGVG